MTSSTKVLAAELFEIAQHAGIDRRALGPGPRAGSNVPDVDTLAPRQALTASSSSVGSIGLPIQPSSPASIQAESFVALTSPIRPRIGSRCRPTEPKR